MPTPNTLTAAKNLIETNVLVIGSDQQALPRPLPWLVRGTARKQHTPSHDEDYACGNGAALNLVRKKQRGVVCPNFYDQS